jgi:phospholipase C
VAATTGLERIEHVVVLMLENRSFDHMLGYLSLDGGRDEVDGRRPGMANDHGGGAIRSTIWRRRTSQTSVGTQSTRRRRPTGR